MKKEERAAFFLELVQRFGVASSKGKEGEGEGEGAVGVDVGGLEEEFEKMELEEEEEGEDEEAVEGMGGWELAPMPYRPKPAEDIDDEI